MSTPSDVHEHEHEHDPQLLMHERKARWVVVLTLAMMVAELAVGYATNSLALTADGWHMATHAGALGMTALAYWFARERAGSRAFSFGTGKVHALAGYTSAVALALIALWMIGESLRRLVHPEPIAFAEALPVAVLGLLVNLVSVKLLHHEHDHEHGHDHEHEHEHGNTQGGHGHGHGHGDHGHDHNLRAAYLHVLADALTSALAIVALVGGRYLGWPFLDSVMGIVGAVVIARWSYGLCTSAARQLLDVVPSTELAERMRATIEREFAGTEVRDLRLWEIGPRARACVVSLVSAAPEPPATYRRALAEVARLEHVTIEVHPLANARSLLERR